MKTWFKQIFTAVNNNLTHSDLKPSSSDSKPIEPKNRTPFKRDWLYEWKDYIFFYLLSLRNFDPNGLTEKLTLAWCTTTARKLRKTCYACWGPYGILLNRNMSRRGFYADVVLDLGCSLVALGGVVLIFWINYWVYSIVLLLGGSILIFITYPLVDFWDLECGPEEFGQYWFDKRTHLLELLEKEQINPLSEYGLFNAPNTLLNRNLPVPDALMLPFFVPFNQKPLNKLHPEWLAISNQKRLQQIASFLTTYGSRSKLVMAHFDKPSYDEEFFNFKTFRDDLLLLDYARSPHGYCEFFFSFAFLAPRTVRTRRVEKNLYGPGFYFKWPYVFPGAPLRDFIFGSGVWLILLGSLGLYYLWTKALWFIALCLSFISVGVVICLVILPSLEDWKDATMFGLVPPVYPYKTGGWYWRYGLKKRLTKTLTNRPFKSLRPLTAWVVFWLYYLF